jgi:hypothetical protein
MDSPALLGIVLDGLSAGFVGHQCLKVLLGVAARQIEKVCVGKVGYVGLWVEKADVAKAVEGLLIDEGEALGVAGDESA